MCIWQWLAGVVLAWFLKAGTFLALFAAAGGCSLAASWYAPSQQQVTDPQQPVSQTNTTESPQRAGPDGTLPQLTPLVPTKPTAP